MNLAVLATGLFNVSLCTETHFIDQTSGGALTSKRVKFAMVPTPTLLERGA